MALWGVASTIDVIVNERKSIVFLIFLLESSWIDLIRWV